jgi:hypothetical protein
MVETSFAIERAGETSQNRNRWRGEFFSLGGLLAPLAGPLPHLLPWACSAAALSFLALWDPITKGGEFDAILLGLAAYEMLIGLTTDPREKARQFDCQSPEASHS